MTSTEAANAAVADLIHRSVQLFFTRQIFQQDQEPWNEEIPTMKAANCLSFIVKRMFSNLSKAEVDQAVIQISNDNRAGCLIILTGPEVRIVGRVLYDGTIDMRFYKQGWFEYGSVLWPDGRQSDFFEEPLEIL